MLHKGSLQVPTIHDMGKQADIGSMLTLWFLVLSFRFMVIVSRYEWSICGCRSWHAFHSNPDIYIETSYSICE